MTTTTASTSTNTDSTIRARMPVSYDRWLKIVERSNPGHPNATRNLPAATLHNLYEKFMNSNAINPASGEIPQSADQALYDNTNSIFRDFWESDEGKKVLSKNESDHQIVAAGGTPAPTPGSPDAASAAAKIKGASGGAADAFAAGMAAGGTATAANLYSGLAVDPKAKVYGQVAPAERALGPQGPDVIRMTMPTYDVQTAGDWLRGLYKMKSPELADVQRRLFSQGWYKNTKITDISQIKLGQPDPATLEAFSEALGETARYNDAGNQIDVDSVIAMGAPGGPGANAQGSPYTTTNPADLKQALKSEAQQNIGKDLPAGAGDQFASQYIADEGAARRQAIAAQAANRTVGIASPASPTAAADAYIDTHNIADRIAYGTAARQQAFFGMLHSPT